MATPEGAWILAPRASENSRAVENETFGHSKCCAKNTAKLTITPTTAAVIAVNGAVNLSLFLVDSINGAPTNIKINDGKKVKNVTIQAAKMPAVSGSVTAT